MEQNMIRSRGGGRRRRGEGFLSCSMLSGQALLICVVEER